MRKGKTVVGQSVISYAEGRRLDTVKDLLISQTNDAIVALLVDEGGLLSGSRVVPIESVRNFGRDAVVVADAGSITTASADPEVKSILNRNDKLLGKRVVSDMGDALGSISDMYFEEESGRIQGFEVSGGVLGDIARGTSYLAVDEIERLGPDVIFVRPDTGENLQSQVGGVLGTLDKAGNRIGETVYSAQDEIQARIAESHPERALVGRRSGTDVTDANGSIVVANGERIRLEHLEWAQRTDNMDALTRAATSGEVRETQARAGAAVEQAGDNIGAMWDRFTQRITDMRDEHGRQVDEQQTRIRLAQIADAIGRPAGKVLLDRSDSVILDLGDIITHQAIQQAYDAGQLDSLLSSAVRSDITLTIDQMRAQQPASATVERASGGAEVVEQLEQKVHESERERAERRERERRDAERAARQRDRERAERARQREQADQQRVGEIEEARASSTAEPSPTAAAESAKPEGVFATGDTDRR